MPIKILLVEDLEMARKGALLAINKCGYQAAVATTGKEAFNLLDKEKFDFILMDLGLPDVSGYEVVESIRANGGVNTTTPVVALTSHEAQEDIQRALKCGMNEFLTKPLTYNMLNTILKKFGLG